MNRNFGKLTGGNLAYAPETIWDGDTCHCNPTAEQYAAQGWLPVIDERPSEKVGVYYVPTGWEERDGAIRRTYREEPMTPPANPVTRYSKLKLITAAKKRGKWADLKEFIEDADMMDEWAACQYLSDDYESFADIKAAAAMALQMTDDEVDAILADAIDEEVR